MASVAKHPQAGLRIGRRLVDQCADLVGHYLVTGVGLEEFEPRNKPLLPDYLRVADCTKLASLTVPASDRMVRLGDANPILPEGTIR